MTMDTQAMSRRLAILKRRPAFKTFDDAYLESMLDNAYSFFLEYTYRSRDIGERIDQLVCDIAVTLINSDGAENTKHAKDGELEREYYESIPPLLLSRLSGYRTVLGVNSEV